MRKRKSLWGIAIAVICLLCSLIFAACNDNKPVEEQPPEPPAGELTISQTAVQLDMHEQVQLTVAEEGETKWESSNTAVCTVENGLVKSVGVGVTTVTASQGDKKSDLYRYRVERKICAANRSERQRFIGGRTDDPRR